MNTFTLTLLFETLGCKLSPLLLLLEPAEENSYYLKASNHSPEHVQVCKWKWKPTGNKLALVFSQNSHQQPQILKESNAAG